MSPAELARCMANSSSSTILATPYCRRQVESATSVTDPERSLETLDGHRFLDVGAPLASRRHGKAPRARPGGQQTAALEQTRRARGSTTELRGRARDLAQALRSGRRARSERKDTRPCERRDHRLSEIAICARCAPACPSHSTSRTPCDRRRPDRRPRKSLPARRTPSRAALLARRGSGRDGMRTTRRATSSS